MSDAVALDLFIQDFVTTNKLLGQHYSWESLVNRRYVEDGRATKVFQFESGGETHLAVGRLLALPDADWLRIELTRPIPMAEEHRFDILKMRSAASHFDLQVDGGAADTVIVKLQTRHRGLVNVVFVIREGAVAASPNPFLV